MVERGQPPTPSVARYCDTVRWHRLNQVPELSPLEELERPTYIKVCAMAARNELPRMTGKDWHNTATAKETFAKKLARLPDQAYVFAARVRDGA